MKKKLILNLSIFSFILCFTGSSQNLEVDGVGKFNLNGGSISLSTPGGWPGIIAYEPTSQHRRDIAFRSEGIALTVSNTSNPPSNNNGIWILENARVGFGRTNPEKSLDVLVPYTMGDPNQGLRTLYSNGYGAALLANPGNIGGWFVTNGGPNYAPIWASDFIVPMSSSANPTHQRAVMPENYEDYVSYFKKIKVSASTERQELELSLDFHSLPIKAQGPENPDQSFGTSAISLTDWTGLNTITIKYLLQKIEKLEKEVQLLKNVEN